MEGLEQIKNDPQQLARYESRLKFKRDMQQFEDHRQASVAAAFTKGLLHGEIRGIQRMLSQREIPGT